MVAFENDGFKGRGGGGDREERKVLTQDLRDERERGRPARVFDLIKI